MKIYNKSGKNKKYLGGFTLVELIVVIAILAILGTIGFTSVSFYNVSARDSSRIENLTNLKKGLDVYGVAVGTYPVPESPVSVFSSGITIGYQGSAKDQIATLAKLSKGGITDPSDPTINITYSANINKTKMQLMAFLESPTPLTPTTSNYSNRTPFVLGDPLGIFLGSTGATLNQPIQENTTVIASGGLDILTSTGGLYNAYVSSVNTISGTGVIFIPLLSNYDNTVGTFPGCDTKNIKLPNGQIWSACNLGATMAFNGSNGGSYNASPSATRGGNDAVNGKLYQWGRNKGFISTDTSQELSQLVSNPNTGIDSFNFAWSGSFSRNDWLQAQIDNIWGGSLTDSGTFEGQLDKIQKKGPCPTGWHVPSTKEFQDMCDSIVGSVCIAGMADTTVRTTLLLPYAGYRHGLFGTYYHQNIYGQYWSSSPSPTSVVSPAYKMNFNSTNIWPSVTSNSRANALSIRCIKD